ncbi:MAG: F0F1 ATP synthase subunit delta [Rhodanobacter sp.]|nr:F0F1 ATP synthase subunit delta [Rhodanobacter sp.]
MLIDWFTVGAQVLNFLILVWLMKRFLYQPILNAIDAREQRIAAEIADADAKRADAQKEREDFRQRNEAFDQQRAALLGKARDGAKAEHQRLLDEARRTVDALEATQREALDNDARELNQTISRRAQQEVFAIARKALGDLAGSSLEERLADVFTRRLRALDDPTLADLAETLRGASKPALLRSAFDLPAQQREAIKKALDETLSADVRLRFETAPNLIGGIELTANGQKVAWSIADYLSALETGIREILDAQADRTPESPPTGATPTPPHSASPKR